MFGERSIMVDLRSGMSGRAMRSLGGLGGKWQMDDRQDDCPSPTAISSIPRRPFANESTAAWHKPRPIVPHSHAHRSFTPMTQLAPLPSHAVAIPSSANRLLDLPSPAEFVGALSEYARFIVVVVAHTIPNYSWSTLTSLLDVVSPKRYVALAQWPTSGPAAQLYPHSFDNTCMPTLLV